VRLLLIKTSSLGDVVHVLPALSDALRAQPSLRVDWVVEEPFAPIAALHTAVETAIPVAIRRWRKHLLEDRTRQEWRSVKAQLRVRPYDLILDAQGLIKSAFLGWQARGPRAGLNWNSAREPIASLSYHLKYTVARALPAIERNRLLMAQALGYEVDRDAPRYGIDRRKIHCSASAPDPHPPRVFCFHGSARPEKCWPENNWIDLGRMLTQQGLALCFPSGNPQEHARAERIASSIQGSVPVDAPLPMPLQMLIPELSRAKAVVGVDTGLLHLSAALGLSGVGIFLSTRPEQFGAIGDGDGDGDGDGNTNHPAFINLGQNASLQVEAVHAAVQRVLR